MSMAGVWVRRPILTTMLTLMVMLIGAVSLSRLPIDIMPDITYPTLTISTSYSNASPEEVEQLITRLVEEAVAAVPGVTETESTSSEGNSRVRVSFVWGADMDAAANDIRDRLDRIIERLPDDASRPQLRKFDAAQFPVLILGVGSATLGPVELGTTIDKLVKHRVERLPGVAALEVFGALAREIHVDVDADKLRALGLSFDTVIAALRQSNVNLPAGEIDRDQHEIAIRTPGEYASLDELRRTVIETRGDAPVVLAQIATVSDSHEDIQRKIRIGEDPGVRVAVRKQSGANTVEVARAVKAEIERINADLPQLTIVPVIDSSTYIERSIDNVTSTVIQGGLLAVLVLLFFLRSFTSTFIISTSIPIAIVATFALIYFGGFTINMMTLGGLALGVGMMVDNSIVVLESVYRQRDEQGLEGEDAAIAGTEQVTGAIIASTLTTLVIFMPLIFVRGSSGVMFQQMAYVVSFALICSLASAVTLVPMLSARLLGKRSTSPRWSPFGWLMRTSEAGLALVEREYGALLRLLLRVPLLVLLVAGALFAGAIHLAQHIGAEFMPATDEGEVRVNVEMDVGTRVELLDRVMLGIERTVRENTPEIGAMVSSVGGSTFSSAPAAGEIRISLVSSSRRQRTSEQIAADLRKQLSHVPGATVRTRVTQAAFMRRFTAGGDSLEVEVRGHDLAVLDALAAEVRTRVSSVEGVSDARASREAGTPQTLIDIDRDRAADLETSVERIAETLETALAGTTAGRYRDGGDEFDIRVRLDGARALSLDGVLDLTVPNRSSEPVVLRNVVTERSVRGPVQIERRNQQRVAVVSANVTGRDMQSVARELDARLREIPCPADYSLTISGSYKEQQEAFAELALSLVLSLILVYMVMACQYESLLDPLIVMFSVPLAAIGVVAALLLTETTFNLQSFIGCIMLGGIVVNNAILLVDQAGVLWKQQGLPVVEALAEAGRLRLRPILMTTSTTLLGLLPLALGIGEGAEAQAPLARAVLGGLASSTAITLVVIPAVYALVHRDARNGGG